MKIGDLAPKCVLDSNIDKEFCINDLDADFIVLYFYPRDNTPGCTSQAKQFNEFLDEFKQLNAIVVGVSKDDIASHKKFAEKYNLKFPLLSDIESELCNKYDVIKEKSMFGKKYMGIVRSTFLFNKNKEIIHIWPKVSVTGHAKEIIAKIKELL